MSLIRDDPVFRDIGRANFSEHLTQVLDGLSGSINGAPVVHDVVVQQHRGEVVNGGLFSRPPGATPGRNVVRSLLEQANGIGSMTRPGAFLNRLAANRVLDPPDLGRFHSRVFLSRYRCWKTLPIPRATADLLSTCRQPLPEVSL